MKRSHKTIPTYQMDNCIGSGKVIKHFQIKIYLCFRVIESFFNFYCLNERRIQHEGFILIFKKNILCYTNLCRNFQDAGITSGMHQIEVYWKYVIKKIIKFRISTAEAIFAGIIFQLEMTLLIMTYLYTRSKVVYVVLIVLNSNLVLELNHPDNHSKTFDVQ